MELIAIAVVAIAVAELGLRRAGFGDFPLIAHDPTVGARYAPAQSGCFRNRHRWHIDQLGLRRDGPGGDCAGATLLVGDSVVDGGWQTHQHETLAARLAMLTGERWLPLAMGGWALANALAAVIALPGWQAARRLVLVVNSADLDSFTIPADEWSYPTRRPPFLLAWLAGRAVAARWPAVFAPWRAGRDRPVTRDALLAQATGLRAGFSGEIVLVRYPLRAELGMPADPFFARLAGALGARALIDVGASPRWTAACYADFIHPDRAGIAVLAGIVAGELDL